MQDMEKHLSFNKTLKLGTYFILFILTVFLIWGIFVKVDLTVQAPGNIIVKNYTKIIAHAKGGVIDKIYIKEGDYVKKGDILMQLDSSQLSSQLQSLKENEMILSAQKARILAELNNSATINFPSDITEKIKQEQLKIFYNRKNNLSNKLTSLQEKINQLKATNEALKENINSKKEMLNSYNDELKKWSNLYKQGLAEEQKIYDLKRKIISIKSDIKNQESQIKTNNIQIQGLKSQMKLTKSEYKKELLDELDKINSQLPSIKSKIKITENEINKNKIKAISDGIVMDLKVHSNGELVLPNKQILTIVPESSTYIVEAMVSPLDIDKVHINQKAEITIASYVDPAAKPIEGKVIYVSPDIIRSPDGKREYYKVLIEITQKGLRAIQENNFKIKPGMPVTVFIKAGKRTFISYILMPLEQLLKGAFHAN